MARSATVRLSPAIQPLAETCAEGASVKHIAASSLAVQVWLKLRGGPSRCGSCQRNGPGAAAAVGLSASGMHLEALLEAGEPRGEPPARELFPERLLALCVGRLARGGEQHVQVVEMEQHLLHLRPGGGQAGTVRCPRRGRAADSIERHAASISKNEQAFIGRRCSSSEPWRPGGGPLGRGPQDGRRRAGWRTTAPPPPHPPPTPAASEEAARDCATRRAQPGTALCHNRGASEPAERRAQRLPRQNSSLRTGSCPYGMVFFSSGLQSSEVATVGELASHSTTVSGVNMHTQESLQQG